MDTTERHGISGTRAGNIGTGSTGTGSASTGSASTNVGTGPGPGTGASISAGGIGSIGSIASGASGATAATGGPGSTTSNLWIGERLSVLDPPADWEPATAVALAQFRSRVDALASTRTSWTRPWTWLTAAIVSSLLLLMLPATRAVAQRLWDVVWVGRMEVVYLDTDRLPASLSASSIHLPNLNQGVPTPAEAARLAGFTPRLPTTPLLPGSPKLTVVGPWSAGLKVNAADLRAALGQAGIVDQVVPQDWDGAQLVAHVSHQVIAEYPDITFAQGRPLALTTPPGFDLRGFTEMVLRIGGLRPAAARTFSLQLSTNPALLLPVAPDEESQMTLREVRLRTGIGTLVHDLSEEGKQARVTLMWSVPDRLYLVSASASDEVVIALANSIQ